MAQDDLIDKRGSSRIPFETNVHIEFEKFSGFISEYSMNISEGGMFINSTTPAPVGTVLSFEFKLKDNFTLIQGLGEVMWTLEPGQAPAEKCGMGIRFRELSPQSRQLITTMIENHRSKGGKVFDLLSDSSESTRSLPFFDVGETEVQDKSNLEALFEVPLLEDEVKSSANSPSESTKKDLESLFSMESPEKGIVDIPPINTKGRMPQEFTKPEFKTSSERSSKKWLLILLGALISMAGAGWLFQDDLLPIVSQVPYLQDMIPIKTTPPPAPTPTVASELAASPTPVEPLHEAASAAPLEAVIETQPIPTPESTPTVVQSAISKPFTKIEKIFWEKIQSGMIVSIQTNGQIDESRFSYISVTEKAPREVIKILGVSEKFKPSLLKVGQEAIEQIRVGHHIAGSQFDIHLVIDLTNPQFRIAKAETQGNILQFYFENKK